jgi:hypothetical protein
LVLEPRMARQLPPRLDLGGIMKTPKDQKAVDEIKQIREVRLDKGARHERAPHGHVTKARLGTRDARIRNSSMRSRDISVQIE